MEEIEKDPRFAHTARDPRFKPNYKQKKVKIDSRFKSMLSDKEFNVKFLDKRGRPINSSTKEDLRRLYQYDSGEEEESSEEEKPEDEESDGEESSGKEGDHEDEEESGENDDQGGGESDSRSSGEEEPEGSEVGQEAEEDDDFPDLTAEDAPDYARGVGVLDSSDDDETEDEEDYEEDEKGILDHNWNEPDHDAPQADEITSRLALCNMDWDRIKARDLFVLFSSFVPQGGAVQSVTIYPSELGRTKMAEEEKQGPSEFRDGEKVKAAKDDGRMGKLDHSRLRRYQLNRLAYYYAVIVCDSKDTANKIYEECDSMEYEKSACRIDLRFIPQGMEFDETPKDSCAGLTDLSTFQPSTFTTTAFCQAKVQVTWDETNIERLTRTMQKKFTEEDLDSNKFDDLVASSDDSSEEEVSPKKKKKQKKTKNRKSDIEKYRKLLGLDGNKSDKENDDDDSPTLAGERQEDEEEEMHLSPSSAEESEDEGEEMQFGPSDGGEREEEEGFPTASSKKKKDKKKKKKTKTANDQDASEDEEEAEGEMQYTWQPIAKQQIQKAQAKKKLTPWEEYRQKKKDKKKEKKQERRREKLKEQGLEDTADLGFDDDFFKDELSEDQTKKKKKKDKKKKRGQGEAVEESEADKKERASLALLMKGEDNDDHKHFNLMQIMKEESEGKKKKGKKRKQGETEGVDSFEVKLDPLRFAALYNDPDMHIDPNAPEFKKTKGMLTLMEEVSKKRRTAKNS